MPATPFSRLGRILALGIPALLVLMPAWYFLAHYLAAPVIAMAAETMRAMFPWVNGYEIRGSTGVLLTHLKVLVQQGNTLAVGYMTPEVSYRTFGYGVVVLWSLFVVSRPSRPVLKGLAATGVLLLLQAVALCFQWLKDTVISGGPDVLLQARMPAWAPDAIAYGYQFSFLILTPLAPVILWVLLNQGYFRDLWLEWTFSAAMERGK